MPRVSSACSGAVLNDPVAGETGRGRQNEPDIHHLSNVIFGHYREVVRKNWGDIGQKDQLLIQNREMKPPFVRPLVGDMIEATKAGNTTGKWNHIPWVRVLFIRYASLASGRIVLKVEEMGAGGDGMNGG